MFNIMIPVLENWTIISYDVNYFLMMDLKKSALQIHVSRVSNII